MHKLLKRATPFTAATVKVPDNFPGASIPAWCPIDIVTGPLNAVTVLPLSSSAVTCTVGIVEGHGSGDVLGCTVKARVVGASLSAMTLASHVLGELKNHVHWGATGLVVADST